MKELMLTLCWGTVIVAFGWRAFREQTRYWRELREQHAWWHEEEQRDG